MPIQAVTGAEQRLEAGAGSLLCGRQVDRKELWPAILALADGTAFYGQGVGLPAVTGGEVVFNTSMAGYQEILTDPSYAGQIITFTYPLIGNYGTNEIYDQSRRPAARGVILRELGSHPHHWRNEGGLGSWLAEQGLTGIAGIDTRALVRRLREQGTMPGVIGPVEVFRPSSPQPGVSHRPDSSRRPASSVRPDWEEDPVAAAAVTAARRLPSLSEEDLLAEVTCAQPYQVGDPRGLPIVVVDLGSKDNILRELVQRGAFVTVVPATSPAEAILARHPAGVVLSNGPGDPERATAAIAATRKLVGQVPLLGICLGHQVFGLAMGARTYKLKFGHRGGNHPVRDVRSGRFTITAQNHGFAVDADSLPPELALTHVNLNDGTVEGLQHRQAAAFSVQYHPEAAPGPRDNTYLFDQFLALCRGKSMQEALQICR